MNSSSNEHIELIRSLDRTGNIPSPAIEVTKFQLDRFVVTIALTEDGKFIGVREVGISTDFLTREQRIASSGYQDVEEFYKD